MKNRKYQVINIEKVAAKDLWKVTVVDKDGQIIEFTWRVTGVGTLSAEFHGPHVFGYSANFGIISIEDKITIEDVKYNIKSFMEARYENE